jgi:hypothetical protein
LSCSLFFEPLTARGVNITETGGQHHRNIHIEAKNTKRYFIKDKKMSDAEGDTIDGRYIYVKRR